MRVMRCELLEGRAGRGGGGSAHLPAPRNSPQHPFAPLPSIAIAAGVHLRASMAAPVAGAQQAAVERAAAGPGDHDDAAGGSEDGQHAQAEAPSGPPGLGSQAPGVGQAHSGASAGSLPNLM